MKIKYIHTIYIYSQIYKENEVLDSKVSLHCIEKIMKIGLYKQREND